ncbi:MAG: LysM peptidoglycan-binding domain-containing protein [Candidatus Acidiferrales bacterium]
MRKRHIARLALAAVTLAAVAVVLTSCEDNVSQHIVVRPPVDQAPAPSIVAESFPPSTYPPAAYPQLSSPAPYMGDLMARIEASYEAGKKAYSSGDLDSARDDFNQAMDWLLAAGAESRTDPELTKLFDRVIETIHSYENEAIESSSAAATEDDMQEPAPIEEIANLNLPAGDPRLIIRAQRELIAFPHDLPLTVNDSVLSYLSFFQTTHGRLIVETGLRRAGRYHDMIVRVLKEEGLPQDLIYLAQAESAFKPEAVSRAGARGIWQFMPFRGQEYDLNRTMYIDERSDPEKATHAAAAHFRDLYQMFGDWYLVMAAYNSGPGNVAKAIERTGYADFWELQRLHALPKQTQNYVPIIIAIALVAKDPARYGVEPHPEAPPPVEIVKPGHSIDLRLVADAIDTDVDALHELNPQLLRFVTPNDPDFQLKIPKGTTERFQAGIANVPPDKWTEWRLHRVDSGDSLAGIAKQYRVTVASLESANHLTNATDLPLGDRLVVPVPPAPVVKLLHYRVEKGDTLEGIAERFDVTVNDLKRWNGIHVNHVPRGTRLKIYAGGGPPAEPARGRHTAKSADATPESPRIQTVARNTQPGAVAAASGATTTQQHRVAAGETLYSIARTYRTSVAAIRENNEFLATRGIQPGDLLAIPASPHP